MRCGCTRLARVLCAAIMVVALRLEHRHSYVVPQRAEQSTILGRESSSGGGGGSSSAAGTARQIAPPNAVVSTGVSAGPTEREAWLKLQRTCAARLLSLSAPSLLNKSDIPVVIMAGARSGYLRRQLQSLDDQGRARLVIVSFNRPKLSESHPTELTKSFEAAATMKHILIWPIWIQSRAASTSLNRHVKMVWIDTMIKVWETLHGYNGDAVFLEDDLLVSPDFFAAVGAASEIKQTNDLAVFSMGGWAGQNIGSDPSLHNPRQFMRKTWSAFPTMGYGFNRSLWHRISEVRDEITNSTGLDCLPLQKFCAHNLDDWSFAVSRSLRLSYNRTHDPYLRNFEVFKEVQLVQPPVSRVWHIGANSSIAEDDTQKVGWKVSELPPWVGLVNRSKRKLTYSLAQGNFDYDGKECLARGETSTTPPCMLQEALLYCQAKPPNVRTGADAWEVCEDTCVAKLLACSSTPVVAERLGLKVSTVRDMATLCFAPSKGILYFRSGCRSWAIREYALR